jgi:hypothetical protein
VATFSEHLILYLSTRGKQKNQKTKKTEKTKKKKSKKPNREKKTD